MTPIGLLDNGEIFGLYDRGDKGVDLQVDGKSMVVTNNMDEIYDRIGGRIEISGMTTTCIMSSFRSLISHYNAREEDLNLMITGGPDGDLGANQIQSYKGKICLVIDGGSVLFDPNGLAKKELMKIAFRRNSSPRANSLSFPSEKLSAQGFMVPISAKNITLPDGTKIEDGALFHGLFWPMLKTESTSARRISKPSYLAEVLRIPSISEMSDSLSRISRSSSLSSKGQTSFLTMWQDVISPLQPTSNK